MFDSLPSFSAVRAVERRILTADSQSSRESWESASDSERRDYVAWLRQQGGFFAEIRLA